MSPPEFLPEAHKKILHGFPKKLLSVFQEFFIGILPEFIPKIYPGIHTGNLEDYLMKLF